MNSENKNLDYPMCFSTSQQNNGSNNGDYVCPFKFAGLSPHQVKMADLKEHDLYCCYHCFAEM